MCRQVAKMLAGSLFSRAFSPRSRRLLYRHPPLSWASSPRSDRGRPPSYARAHSPAPLVLSPGIYNTLCFPSAICLGFSAPSLTLLSRVLFLFNSAVSFRIPSSRHPRYLSEGLNERTPRRIWTILCVWVIRGASGSAESRCCFLVSCKSLRILILWLYFCYKKGWILLIHYKVGTHGFKMVGH